VIFDRFYTKRVNRRRQVTVLDLITSQIEKGPLSVQLRIKYERFGAGKSSESIDLPYGDVVLLHKALGGWLQEHEEDYCVHESDDCTEH